jgi:hypothetical protein
MSIQGLCDVFRDKIISRGIWPAHSPHLNPCDFFFCGSLKDNIYNSEPWLEKMKENILRKLQIFLQDSFKGLIRTSSDSVRKVYLEERQHLQHLL